jgi:hypothetical protein
MLLGRVAVDTDLASIRPDGPNDYFEKGALSGPVGPHDGNVLAFGNGKSHVLQGETA